MPNEQTETLLKEALRLASEGPEIEDWLLSEGLDPAVVGQFLLFLSEKHPNPLETMTQIGKGFHIGWEARRLMEMQD
jgi:hypothetical protein